MKKYQLTAAIVLAACTIGGAVMAQDSVEDFFRGKTITMYIGTGSSTGATGTYPRTMANFISKYLPGNPDVIVTNMPGAGGLTLANYMYHDAPQDGTAWAFITAGFLQAPLMRYEGVRFDPLDFNWVGSPAETAKVGYIWTASTDVRTIEEAMETEVIVGATAPTQDTSVFPTALNKYLGTKFRIITGYPSAGDVDLGLQNGELEGAIGMTYASLNSTSTANWVSDELVKVIVQLGTEKSPDLPNVPLAIDLAETEEGKGVLRLLASPSALGYPSFLGPNVPAERVEAIREAFDLTMQDPEFIALLERQGLAHSPIPGDKVAEIVREMYDVSESVAEEARLLVNVQ